MSNPEEEVKQEAPVEEEEKELEPEYTYPPEYIPKELPDSSIPTKFLSHFQTFGFDSSKRYNLHFLDDEHIIYISGSAFYIMDINSKEKQMYQSKEGSGIGSVAVHPSKSFFAVAEKGDAPNIYVYTYPDLKLKRILKKGTEKSYSHICFSANGEKIASVGNAPDFQLCVWDWMGQKVLLKAKAFSQEVYRVAFSDYNENILTTSGMGHIKFWKIAETFTGLKLKGEIAKFGQTELSDVTAFYIFPDEKVISGTEYGKLLLWEGNMIKAVVSIDEETPCHRGAIESIHLENDHIVTAGADGFINFWNFAQIDGAEGDDQLNFYITPSRQYQIKSNESTPAYLLTVIRNDQFWITFDQNGYIWKLKQPEFEQELVMATNSGRMMDLAVSTRINAAVSIGDDGALRLWDYVARKEFYCRAFKGKGTCLEWLPQNEFNKGRVVYAGYEDGVMRTLVLMKAKFVLVKAVRVFRAPIFKILISPSATIMVVVTQKGDLFFISLDLKNPQTLEPYCLLESSFQINDICWNEMSTKLLIACQDGKVRELTIPRKDECDARETYLRDMSYIFVREHTIKMMESQKPKLDEYEEFLLARKDPKLIKDKLEEEWDPAPVLTCAYYDQYGDRFVCSAEGKYLGFYYICRWGVDRPEEGIPSTPLAAKFLKFYNSYQLLAAGQDNGTFIMYRKENLNKMLVRSGHDRDYGRIRKVEFSYDTRMVLTCSEDGTINAYLTDMDGIKQICNGDEFASASFGDMDLTIPEWFFDEDIAFTGPVEEDITGDVYSIQEDKLHTEEDAKKTMAEKNKQKVLSLIKQLQGKYQELKESNSQLAESFRLTEQEIEIDAEYTSILRERVQFLLDETDKELEWDIKYHELQKDKLKEYMIDEVQCEKFTLKAFKAHNYVTTFKVKKLPEYAERHLDDINRILEEEFQLLQEEKNKNQARRDENETKGDFKSTTKKTLTQKGMKLDDDRGKSRSPARNKKTMTIEKKPYEKYDREKAKKEAEERQAELAELERNRPNRENFKPEVDEEITRFGDKKLRSAADYIVPEEQRMNVSKKRKQMFLLYEILYNSKKEFNDKVTSLRTKKIDLCAKIAEKNKRLREIDTELELPDIEYYTPTVDSSIETPEKIYEITESMIDEWSKKKEEERLAAQNKNMFGGGSGAQGQAQPADDKKAPLSSGKEKDSAREKDKDTGKIIIQTKDRKSKRPDPSKLELELKEANRLRLESEKQFIMKEIESELEEFDKQIEKLQLDKAFLEANMKVVEMKLVTFYQELIILNDMEDHDNMLINNLLEARKEKGNYEAQNSEITKQILENGVRALNNERELGDVTAKYNQYFMDDLTKANKIFAFYQKQHRRRAERELKKKAEGDDAGDDDVDDDDDSFDDDDDDEEEKVDISPVESDPELGKLVQKRNELEDTKIALIKEKESLETQRRITNNKLNQVGTQIAKTERDLRDYQREKMQRVNKLYVSHFLELSQIQNLVSHKDSNGNEVHEMPSDLGYSTLFTENELNRLHARIGELVEERIKIENKNKRAEKEWKRLAKAIDKLKKEKQDAEKANIDEHMLRFGDYMDLEILDAMVPTKEVKQKREDFSKEEKEAEKRVEEAKQKFLAVKKRLLEEKKENTRILKKITSLGETQMKLNKNLDSTNKQLFKEDNEDKKTNLSKERGHLIELVKFLAKEIEDLKTEIGLFKKKGGHIYTMVTSNKKTLDEMT